MAKRSNDTETKSISIRISKEAVEKITGLLNKDRDLKLEYKSRNNFIAIAVENEIEIATLKHGLSNSGKYHFKFLYNNGVIDAYQQAKGIDAKGDRPSYVVHKEIKDGLKKD